MRIAFNNVEFVGRDSKFVNALIVSYQNGFRTGLEWREDWNHRPGGPFVIHKCKYHTWDHKNYTRPDWLKCACDASRENWEAWMKGFDAGVKLNPNLKPGHQALKRR